MSDHGPTGGSSRHSSPLGEWERAWRRPSPLLRGLISGYDGYRQRLAAAALHRGVPSATVPLVLSLGPPQTVTPSSGAHPARTVTSFIAGIHDSHVLIEAEEFHGVQIDLSPVAAFRLLGQPLRELTGLTVPLEELLGGEGRRLVERVASASGWRQRFELLDRALTSRLVVGVDPRPEVVHAWELIRAARGRVRVSTLAQAVGYSQRHLTARFGEQLGLSPKRMASLVRFETVAQLLARPDGPNLAGAAAATGYYDQAHMTNEVRAFCGLTPAHLIARRLPDHGGVFDRESAVDDVNRSRSSKRPGPTST